MMDSPSTPTPEGGMPKQTYQESMRQMPCLNCHRLPTEHFLANFADGPQIGMTLMICPTTVYHG